MVIKIDILCKIYLHPIKKFIEEDDDRTDIEKLESKRSEKAEGEWLLKPCIYKRR